MSYTATNPIFNNLFEIVEEIDKHPFLPKALETTEEGTWLAMNNICNEHHEAPADFKELMQRLALELDGTLISSSGQHSSAFYALRKEGWGCRTGESDSFGPLSSIMVPWHHKWQVCYG